MSYPILTLKEGRSNSVRFHHPWIFSGALTSLSASHGEIVRVADGDGAILGTGTFSASSNIAVRVFHFGAQEVELNEEWFVAKFIALAENRMHMGFGPGTETTGYRLAMSEADGMPGVIVDKYDDVLVLQLSTAGADALREVIVAALVSAFSPVAIVERSDVHVRKEEGLTDDVVGVRYGTLPETVTFLEYGVQFVADVLGGQKTGFFLDQKDLRKSITALSAGRKVLNVFSYTGSAGIAAMKGGAESVHNVDASDTALAGAALHRDMHKIPEAAFTSEMADAFQYLSTATGSYGMVLVDPPALIKSEKHVEEGKKAYHFLNRAGMRLVEDGGIFVTSSCSRYMTEDDLMFVLRRASVQAGVELSVIAKIHQAPDHPLSVYFPEALYLTSFVCVVRRV